MNENTESRFNKISYWIMMLNIMVEQLSTLMNDTAKSDSLILKNERGAVLKVCELHRELGIPTRYTMEDYAVFNNIVDIDEFIDHIESFKLDEAVSRITMLVGSATFDKFLKAFRELRKESNDGLKVSNIIFAYLSGDLALYHIPVTKEGIKWLKLVMDQDLNGTQTLDSYIDTYADKEYLYGENCEYDPEENSKSDGMYYGVFVDPNAKVSIDGKVLEEFENYQEFRAYVLNKASIYYARMKAYNNMLAFIEKVVDDNFPMMSNMYAVKSDFFRLVLENLTDGSPLRKSILVLLRSGAAPTNVDEIIALASDETLEDLKAYKDGFATKELYETISHIDNVLTDSAFSILNHIPVEIFDYDIDWIYRTGDVEDMIHDTYRMASIIHDYVCRNTLISDSVSTESGYESLAYAISCDHDLKVFLDSMKVGIHDLIKGVLHFEMFNLFFDKADSAIPANNFRFAVALQDTCHFLQALISKLDIKRTTDMTRRRYDRV